MNTVRNMKNGVLRNDSMERTEKKGKENSKNIEYSLRTMFIFPFFFCGRSSLAAHQRKPFYHQYKWKDFKVASAHFCWALKLLYEVVR